MPLPGGREIEHSSVISNIITMLNMNTVKLLEICVTFACMLIIRYDVRRNYARNIRYELRVKLR